MLMFVSNGDIFSLKPLIKTSSGNPPPPIVSFNDDGGDDDDHNPHKPPTFWQSFLTNGLALFMCYSVNLTHQFIKQPMLHNTARIEVPQPPKNNFKPPCN